MISESKKRYHLIDEMRGFTIILMIIFHIAFDLTLFRFTNISFQHSPFWFYLPRVIVFIFFICVGFSLSIVHKDGIQWQKFWIRWVKLAFFALIISIATYNMFPTRWVYFGTLHSIAICSLFALPFIGRAKLSLLTAMALYLLTAFDYQIPWITLSHKSMDYISPFPWLGIILLGIALYSKNIHKLEVKFIPGRRVLRFLGRHALITYLIHQPLIYGIIFLIYTFTK